MTSPLGADDLVATDLRGREAVSTPYLFTVDCLSPLETIAPESLLGKHVTVTVDAHGGARHFGGIVRSLEPGSAVTREMRAYRLELVPTLWLLSLGADLRIFQEQSTLDIVETLFSEHGLTDYDFAGVTATPPARLYCVQYRETHLDFVSRLLEEEGFFYYFEFEQTRHILKVADSTAAYTRASTDCALGAPNEARRLRSWAPRHDTRSGKFTLHDYDYEQPGVVTATESTVIKRPSFTTEVYDYPGRFKTTERGRSLVGARLQAHEAGFETVDGTGQVAEFRPGLSFTLSDHPSGDQSGRDFAVTAVDHHAIDHTQMTGMSGAEDYTNAFVCIPAATVFRPERRTPRPLVAGPHTAMVVGASNEEIHTDNQGRIKVQFQWDREGKNDDRSSCYIRVAQTLAGNGWGTVFLPRVGMEVVVEFLEGDPDRPLVTGCVYNGKNKHPYALPTNKTQSGFKSRSTPRGKAADFNELRFEDKKGSEQVYFHAQKDFERMVEDSDTLTVQQGDRTVTLEEGSESVTLNKGDQSITLDKGSQSVTLSKGDHTLKMSAGKSTTDAAKKIVLKVGGSTVTVEPAKITLDSTQIEIKGKGQIKLQAPMVDINASGMVKIKGGVVKIN